MPNSGIERLLSPAILYTDQKRREFEISYLSREQQNIGRFEEKFASVFRLRNPPKTKVGWLSLMQHYGLPTRLLDFSSDVYVSMFMASERQTPDLGISIWSIDVRGILPDWQHKSGNSELEHILTSPPEYIVDEYFAREVNVLLINDDERESANRRIKPQSGLFLSFDRLVDPPFGAVARMMGMGSMVDLWARSVMWPRCGFPPVAQLDQIYGIIEACPIIEFVFPSSCRLQMLDIAESHGATRRRLFPDLEIDEEVRDLMLEINFDNVYRDSGYEWLCGDKS